MNWTTGLTGTEFWFNLIEQTNNKHLCLVMWIIEHLHTTQESEV